MGKNALSYSMELENLLIQAMEQADNHNVTVETLVLSKEQMASPARFKRN